MEYRHPGVEQVCATLRGGEPANVGDLAALVVDKLRELAVDVQRARTGGQTQSDAIPRAQAQDILLRDGRVRGPTWMSMAGREWTP